VKVFKTKTTVDNLTFTVESGNLFYNTTWFTQLYDIRYRYLVPLP
jgi:hypothetical protein